VPPLHHRIHFPIPHTLSITHHSSPPARARHTVRPVTRPLSDSPRPRYPYDTSRASSPSSPTRRLYPLLNAAAPTFTIAVHFLSTLHPSNHPSSQPFRVQYNNQPSRDHPLSTRNDRPNTTIYARVELAESVENQVVNAPIRSAPTR
jgi:hypothetical protein